MLNNKQKFVAYELDGNTIVSASPGSGKTKTLVARANKKNDDLPSHKILGLITYTNAAADEIESRLLIESNSYFVGTIHKFCLTYILKPFGWLYNWHKPRVVKFSELVEFFSIHNDIDLGANKFDELSKIKKLPNGDLDYNVNWENELSLAYVADIYFDYLDSIHALDFNEIIYRSYKIINENPFVARSLSSKFFEILVDEFQDTNFYQFEILRKINAAGDCTFFLVGDERQRIYSFAGALENSFKMASNDFGCEIELLDNTYRSTKNIVDAYCRLFEGHPVLTTNAPHANEDIPVERHEINNSNRLRVIKSLIDRFLEAGVELNNIAVLSITWYDAMPISRYLRQYFNITGLGALPHKSVNNTTFTLLKILTKYQYSKSISTIRSLRRNIELHDLENNLNLSLEQTIVCLNNIITDFIKVDKSLSLIDGISEIKNVFDKVFKTEHSSFDELLSVINADEVLHWTLEKYLETLAGINGIQITTIHQSKGLEYDAVILNNINENKIPYQKCLDTNNWIYEHITNENLEAGRCLLYVAMSRARLKLDILHTFRPSLFLDLIDAN